jgi:stage V sporulation protein AC
MDKKEKEQLIKKYEIKSPLVKNLIRAFIFGGLICLMGELFKMLYIYLGIEETLAKTLTTVTLIFIASVLTGFGVFDNIARYAGAGTLVPVTGFSNAVTSEAMDSRSEGIILGVGAKIFTVAGPVILFGITSGVIYGVIYFIINTIKSIL